MALADIVERIGSDADTEAEEILAAANERAEALVAVARAEATQAAADTVADAERRARIDADTLRANARLSARDTALAAKGALVEEALAAVSDAIVALDDSDYVRVLASRVAAAARGGETVRIARADVGRLGAILPPAVREALTGRPGGAVELEFGDPTDAIQHGVVLEGARSHVDLSVDAIVAERHDDLAVEAASILFRTGGAA